MCSDNWSHATSEAKIKKNSRNPTEKNMRNPVKGALYIIAHHYRWWSWGRNGGATCSDNTCNAIKSPAKSNTQDPKTPEPKAPVKIVFNEWVAGWLAGWLKKKRKKDPHPRFWKGYLSSLAHYSGFIYFSVHSMELHIHNHMDVQVQVPVWSQIKSSVLPSQKCKFSQPHQTSY